MSDVDEFVDVFEPAAPEFWITIGHEHHADADAQEQQSQGPQLFHELHSYSPSIKRARDNFSTVGYFFRENGRLYQTIAIQNRQL
jgi:hypothetical protein